MKHLIDALRHYIEDGLVSVVSKSGDEIDGISSVLGLSFHNTHVENMVITMNLYLSKGSIPCDINFFVFRLLTFFVLLFNY